MSITSGLRVSTASLSMAGASVVRSANTLSPPHSDSTSLTTCVARQGVQRPVPHLVEHLEPRARRVPRAQLRELVPVAARGRRRHRLGPGETAELEQRRTDIVQVVLVRDIQSQIQALQFRLAARGRAGIPEHDQRGLESQQALDIERRRFADACNAGDRRRVIAGIVDADDSVAGAGGKQQFGDVRTQADDSRRRFRPRRAPAASDRRSASVKLNRPSAPDRHVGMDYNVAARKMGRKLLFQQLERLNPDSILGLMAKYRADPFATESRSRRRCVPRSRAAIPRCSTACAAPSRRSWRRKPRSPTWPPRAARNSTAPSRNWCLGTAHAARRDRRARTVQTPGRLRRPAAWAPNSFAPPRPPSRCTSAIRPGAITRPCWAARDCGSSATPTTMPPRTELRFDAMLRAPRPRRRRRCRADSRLLPQSHRRRSRSGAVAGAGSNCCSAGASSRFWILRIRDSPSTWTPMPPACAWSPNRFPRR